MTEMGLYPSLIRYVPWPKDAASYQNKPEILFLNFNNKERSEIVFLTDDIRNK